MLAFWSCVASVAGCRYCCQSPVCILELGCWYSCKGAAAGCCCKVLLSECPCCCWGGKLRQVLSRLQSVFEFSLLVSRSGRALVRWYASVPRFGCVSFCLCYACSGAANIISSTSSRKKEQRTNISTSGPTPRRNPKALMQKCFMILSIFAGDFNGKSVC